MRCTGAFPKDPPHLPDDPNMRRSSYRLRAELLQSAWITVKYLKCSKEEASPSAKTFWCVSKAPCTSPAP